MRARPASLNVRVAAADRPVFSYGHQLIDASNGDGLIQPGEAYTLRVTVKNTGKGEAAKTTAVLRNVSGNDLLLKKTRFELGNLNLPGVHALAASLDLIFRVGVRNIGAHVLSLGDRLIAHLDALGIALVGPRSRQHRSHIYVLALPVAEWVGYLTESGVRVSPERDGVRVSFGLFNTLDDVDRLAAILRARLLR